MGLTYFIQKFPNFKMVITLLILLTPLDYYSVKEISNRTGVSKATLYRRLTEIENEEK